MYNLLLKELRLSVHPFYYFMPFLTGALMLVPGWLYFVVFLYFCFITVPNIFATYKAQNDLIFTTLLPVNRRDVVAARVVMIVLLEMLHMVTAVGFGILNRQLYGDWLPVFLYPTIGFWGLCFVMLGIFNLLFFPIYYKTSYKYGLANVIGILGAMLFAGGIEWLAIKNERMIYLFKGQGILNNGMHIVISQSSEKPIYQQIYEQLSAQVLNGSLKPGFMLPPIRQAAIDLKVSVITVKKAWESLERDGLINTTVGKGCFVADFEPLEIKRLRHEQIRKHLFQDLQYYLSLGMSIEELIEMITSLQNELST